MTIEIRPQPGMQEKFLSTPADIAIGGGAAGAGKSYALLLQPLAHIHLKNFAAVIFRQNLADVRKAGGLLDTSGAIYPSVGSGGFLGEYNGANFTWQWGSGPGAAKVVFGHLEHENTKFKWQGSQVPLICFDELTHFSRSQFFYMLSRNRLGGCKGMRPYIRATCNPDPDSWVREFISWWIGDDGFPIAERAGRVRWFVNVADHVFWADTAAELQARHPGSRPKSVSFVPGKLADNKILEDGDPDYRSNLEALDAVSRAQLLDGNWNIRAAAGLMFNRHWCQMIDALPHGHIDWARGWDLAATPKTDSNDPDWTWGVKIGQHENGCMIVGDAVFFRDTPARVQAEVRAVAEWDGAECLQSIPQDPGQAGKGQVATYIDVLQGYPVRSHPVANTGSKIVRFSAFSAAAEHKKVLVMRAPWNQAWWSNLEAFPDGAHDDGVDATSEAYHALATMPKRRKLVFGSAGGNR